jgi:hypothetical protein
VSLQGTRSLTNHSAIRLVRTGSYSSGSVALVPCVMSHDGVQNPDSNGKRHAGERVHQSCICEPSGQERETSLKAGVSQRELVRHDAGGSRHSGLCAADAWKVLRCDSGPIPNGHLLPITVRQGLFSIAEFQITQHRPECPTDRTAGAWGYISLEVLATSSPFPILLLLFHFLASLRFFYSN